MIRHLTLKVDYEATIEIEMLKISQAIAAVLDTEIHFPSKKQVCLVLHFYLLLIHPSRAPIKFLVFMKS